jgi:uncharacterized protein
MSDKKSVPDNLLKNIGKQRGPAPVHAWNPPFCGDIDMRIAADGQWYYQGSPIGRKKMVALFSAILRLDDDGKYYLVTPVEKVGIQVDDCPFVAVLMDVSGQGRDQQLSFTLNTDETVVAGAEHPIEVDVDESGQPHPVIEVRHGLKALISRSVFYQLVAMAEIGSELTDSPEPAENKASSESVSVWSHGKLFALGQF